MKHCLRPLWALLFLLAGCGTSAPVPEDRFYQLDVFANPESRAEPVLSGGLIIDRVSADPLRSGRAILYVDIKKPLEIKRYHYEFWVDQPPELVKRALLAYCRETRLADLAVQDFELSNARYRLSTRLQRFEELRDSARGSAAVEVELEVTLSSNTSRTVLWTQNYRQRQPVSDSNMHATASAMEAALGAVLERLGKDLGALELDR